MTASWDFPQMLVADYDSKVMRKGSEDGANDNLPHFK
jgi:hypothetical protein